MSQTAYGNWLNGFKSLLGRCFEVQTIKMKKESFSCRKFKSARDVIARISKKGKIQRVISKTYQEKLVEFEIEIMEKLRSERLKKTVSQLTANDKFSPSGYWKMKKAIKKCERKTEVLSSVRKGNGVEVDGSEAVKEAYREEFERRLANRKPKQGWEKYVEETYQIITGSGYKALVDPQPPSR